jgi:predicted amidohydrolase
VDSESGLPFVSNPEKQIEKIKKCLDIAKNKNINVLILPECALSLQGEYRKSLLSYIKDFSKENDMVIIAGSFYDENRNSRTVLVLPDGVYLGYKIRPSKFEVSPFEGKGMQFADTLFVLKTKYGNILPLTCVDLISDDANYIARYLSNRGLIDFLVNINYNPASQEFMREASSLVLRHPLFVSITNVTVGKAGCSDNDLEYGNSAVFGSISKEFQLSLIEKISDCYKNYNKKSLQPAYRTLLSHVNPEKEGILNYEINLRLIRTPAQTNAPDQGYPTIRNINIIDLK